MFMKLLLTLLIVVGAVVVLRLRKRPPSPAAIVHVDENILADREKTSFPRLAAYTVLGILLLACAGAVFFQIQDAWQVVTVRVIDAGSGRESTYRAYKSDVGGRTFTTTDGRTVKLADVERMELGER